jgi:hypothetical protein
MYRNAKTPQMIAFAYLVKFFKVNRMSRRYFFPTREIPRRLAKLGERHTLAKLYGPRPGPGGWSSK